MKIRFLAIVLLSIAMGAIEAPAAPRGTKALSGRSVRSAPRVSTGRSVRQSSSSFRRVPGRRAPSLRLPGASGSRSSRSGLSALSNLAGSGLGDLPFREGASGYGPLADLLGQGFGDRGYHRAEHEMADAYRDVGIANAVVDLLGILVAACPQEARAVAVPVVHTAPVAVPSGHIEQQRILIREGHYEQYQVWVPEYVVAATGERVEGHHETRRRWVDPVYQVREVWVPGS